MQLRPLAPNFKIPAMAMHPLHGWIPRKVTASQVTEVMDGDVNPFTKKPLSPAYKKILEARKKLPVYGYMDEFYKIVCMDLKLRVLAQ
jgi:pre-mRNA-splicing factor ATP-dependent RNA helicase DHX15/PRP43